MNDLLGKIDRLEAVWVGLNTTEEHQFKHNYGAGMRMFYLDDCRRCCRRGF